MGQVLPLPERAPLPDNDQERQHLEGLGFVFGEEEGGYVSLKLPEGFSWKDNSYRADIPEWYVIDESGKAILSVSGSWKGTYDNQLRMAVHVDPIDVTWRSSSPIPSETDGPAIAAKLADAEVTDVIGPGDTW